MDCSNISWYLSTTWEISQQQKNKSLNIDEISQCTMKSLNMPWHISTCHEIAQQTEKFTNHHTMTYFIIRETSQQIEASLNKLRNLPINLPWNRATNWKINIPWHLHTVNKALVLHLTIAYGASEIKNAMSRRLELDLPWNTAMCRQCCCWKTVRCKTIQWTFIQIMR